MAKKRLPKKRRKSNQADPVENSLIRTPSSSYSGTVMLCLLAVTILLFSLYFGLDYLSVDKLSKKRKVSKDKLKFATMLGLFRSEDQKPLLNQPGFAINLLETINRLLTEPYHGERLSRVLNNASLVYDPYYPHKSVSAYVQNRETIQDTITIGFTSQVDFTRLLLILRHESVHAWMILRNSKLIQSRCRTDENNLDELIAIAAPFYPLSINEMDFYIKLINIGMERLIHLLDTQDHPKNKNLIATLKSILYDSDYTPKTHSFPVSDIESLNCPKTISISAPDSLILKSNGDIVFPFLATQSAEPRFMPGIGEVSICTGVFSTDQFAGYMFDTLASDLLIQDNIRAKPPIMHVIELDAHLKEQQPPKALWMFFPELMKYERERNSGCPRVPGV